jgi:hypothetical protein
MICRIIKPKFVLSTQLNNVELNNMNQNRGHDIVIILHINNCFIIYLNDGIANILCVFTILQYFGSPHDGTICV